MVPFFSRYRMVLLVLALVGLMTTGLLVSCNSLQPQMSYQGSLTDSAGNPLSGSYNFRFRLFDDDTGGTAVYTETKTIDVTNGIFDAIVGPGTLIGSVDPKLLARPLWMEVTVNDEVMTPRQHLYGAPYAFTLMPGAVISSTFTAALPEENFNAILTIINRAPAGTGTSAPLPVLRLEGMGGLELVGAATGNTVGQASTIFSDKDAIHGDLRLASNDGVYIDLDDDNNSSGTLFIRNGADASACTIAENGDLTCAGAKAAVVSAEGEQRKLYAIESPGVWFEDFGSGALENGSAAVAIDPIFAATVNLDDYHVFVTPLGECQGLYVTNKTATGFDVRELGGGVTNVGFDYRIVARRLGYEDTRLEVVDQNSLTGLDEEEK